MDAEQRYLFDLQGYLVLRQILNPAEVAELERAIDADPRLSESGHTGLDARWARRGNADPAAGPVDRDCGHLLELGAPFRRLVARAALIDPLVELVGDAFRLDHAYLVVNRAGDRSVAHKLHCGGTPRDPSQAYAFHGGRFENGLVGAIFALTDAPEGAGGFCCIPGSHKARLSLPSGWDDPERAFAVVRQPALERGDVLLFTEGLTHGALPWRARHDRRVLIYKYCPGFMQWEPGSPYVDVNRHDFSLLEALILSPPSAGYRSSVALASAIASGGVAAVSSDEVRIRRDVLRLCTEIDPLRQASLRPGRGGRGVELVDVRPASLLAALDLRDHDVLLAVDDMTIGYGESELARAFARMLDAPRSALRYARKDEERVLHLSPVAP
jgi:ectoine hydroxylase-related dioxygenase (phytanoyl-CoA dioxygenase family)